VVQRVIPLRRVREIPQIVLQEPQRRVRDDVVVPVVRLLVVRDEAQTVVGAVARDLVAGFGVAARRKAGASIFSRDGAPAADVAGVQRSGSDVLVARGAPPTKYPQLALAGVRCKVGATRSTAAPGSRRTRVGFRPRALVAFSWGLGARPEPTDICRLCIGAAAGGVIGCAGWDDRDVPAATTATHVCSSEEHLVVVTNTQTGGIHAHARLESFDERGFTLAWDRSDGYEREVMYVALGPKRRLPWR
jgi:hypothetical protein